MYLVTIEVGLRNAIQAQESIRNANIIADQITSNSWSAWIIDEDNYENLEMFVNEIHELFAQDGITEYDIYVGHEIEGQIL